MCVCIVVMNSFTEELRLKHHMCSVEGKCNYCGNDLLERHRMMHTMKVDTDTDEFCERWNIKKDRLTVIVDRDCVYMCNSKLAIADRMYEIFYPIQNFLDKLKERKNLKVYLDYSNRLPIINLVEGLLCNHFECE